MAVTIGVEVDDHLANISRDKRRKYFVFKVGGNWRTTSGPAVLRYCSRSISILYNTSLLFVNINTLQYFSPICQYQYFTLLLSYWSISILYNASLLLVNSS